MAIWIPVDHVESSALTSARSVRLPTRIEDVMLTRNFDHPTRLPALIDSVTAPWLHVGAVCERRGTYDRRLAVKKPETGGFMQRDIGSLLQVAESDSGAHGLIARSKSLDGEIALEWWPLVTATVCVGVDALTQPTLAIACSFLLRTLIVEEMQSVFARQIANCVIVEGARGRVQRGILIANHASISRETLGLAESSRYDLIAGQTIDASTVQTAVATCCLAVAMRGQLERLTRQAVYLRAP